MIKLYFCNQMALFAALLFSVYSFSLPAASAEKDRRVSLAYAVPANRGATILEQRSSGEFVLVALKAPILIPDLPVYSGQAKYLYGTLSPHTRGGAYYIQKFSVRENSAVVINWYREAFKLAKWQLDRGLQSDCYVGAVDSRGNMCQIGITASTSSGYACDLVIQYRSRSGGI